jgi:hypothetical protein
MGTSQLAMLRYDPAPYKDATFICFIDIDTHVLFFLFSVNADSDVRTCPYNPKTKLEADRCLMERQLHLHWQDDFSACLHCQWFKV